MDFFNRFAAQLKNARAWKLNQGNCELYIDEQRIIILQYHEKDDDFLEISVNYVSAHNSKLICLTREQKLVEIANRDLYFESAADAEDAYNLLCTYNTNPNCSKFADPQ